MTQIGGGSWYQAFGERAVTLNEVFSGWGGPALLALQEALRMHSRNERSAAAMLKRELLLLEIDGLKLMRKSRGTGKPKAYYVARVREGFSTSAPSVGG
jgi:hypothetical protein